MVARHYTFRVKNRLHSLDATAIDLCASLSPWATFRRTKYAVKVYGVFNHRRYRLAWAHSTEGTGHESRAVPDVPLLPSSIVAVERSDNDDRQY